MKVIQVEGGVWLNTSLIENFVDMTRNDENPVVFIITTTGKSYKYLGTEDMFMNELGLV
jgi:hypothetical protein